MVTEKKREILQQILDLLDTACEASLELLGLYTNGRPAEAVRLLEDLAAVVQAVQTAQEPLLPQLEHAYTSEMLENVEDTLDDIQRSMDAGDADRAAMKMEFQLFPFLRYLRGAFYFWGNIYPDKQAMECYYQKEFAATHQNFYIQGETPPQYKASVVVVAYNHLEMTKRCVESILKCTDFGTLNAELILVDHGSTDGVLEYFDSLGMGKVIHFRKNMRGAMFCILPQLCNSKYYVHVANDTVVTKDWLNILLNCAESDQKIAIAVPATCNISNLQGINVPVSDCEELVKLAEQYNHPDPHMWNDRARALPAIGLFSISALNETGFWDPLIYTFDFTDDDFSLRARRSGYRQILCEDVICYHQGTATHKKTQATEGTLEEGRKIFMESHGVDAWGTGFCYDYQGLQQYDFDFEKNNAVKILGLDCGFGDTVLQIRNQIRRKDCEGNIYHITTDKRYIPDLRPHSEETIFAHSGELLAVLEHCFSDIQFDIIFLGQELTNYPEPYLLLDALSRRMAYGGQLVCFFPNPYFAIRLHQMLQFSISDSPVRLLHPEQVTSEMGKYFSNVRLTGIVQPVQGLENFIIQHYGRGFLKSSQKKRIEINRYYMMCIK